MIGTKVNRLLNRTLEPTAVISCSNSKTYQFSSGALIRTGTTMIQASLSFSLSIPVGSEQPWKLGGSQNGTDRLDIIWIF